MMSRPFYPRSVVSKSKAEFFPKFILPAHLKVSTNRIAGGATWQHVGNHQLDVPNQRKKTLDLSKEFENNEWESYYSAQL